MRQGQIEHHLRYEKLLDVTLIENPEQVFFFFKNGQLKMIYTSDEFAAKAVWDEFRAIPTASSPEKIVRSRSKTSNQEIFCSLGLTASLVKDQVDFIEVYPPCSLQETWPRYTMTRCLSSGGQKNRW